MVTLTVLESDSASESGLDSAFSSGAASSVVSASSSGAVTSAGAVEASAADSSDSGEVSCVVEQPVMRSSAAAAMAIFLMTGCSTTQETSRSEEHTSELQSRGHLVCSLLLEKKNTKGNK